jgi:hypothetical protein
MAWWDRIDRVELRVTNRGEKRQRSEILRFAQNFRRVWVFRGDELVRGGR